MTPFAIIVAVDKKNGIGLNNELPWSLKADMAHFRNITSTTTDPTKQNAVIMGRKTWESIPEKFRPLPNRHNIVLTRSQTLDVPEGAVAQSLDTALTECQGGVNAGKIEKVFIIGGGTIYEEAIVHPLCKQVFVTEIDAEFDCDAFFPTYKERFTRHSKSEPVEEGGVSFSFIKYEK